MSGNHSLDTSQPDGPPPGVWTAILAATGLAPTLAPPQPFSWQHGRSLWILNCEATGWVLAELQFDPDACHYRELRRACYTWPREAAGVLLGRALALGNAEAEDIASRLVRWQRADQRPRA